MTTKLKKFYPFIGGCCIGAAYILLVPTNIFVAVVSALLFSVGIFLIIYSYK